MMMEVYFQDFLLNQIQELILLKTLQSKYYFLIFECFLTNKMKKNMFRYINKHKFNGIDLDWKYPNRTSGRFSDKKNFFALIKV